MKKLYSFMPFFHIFRFHGDFDDPCDDCKTSLLDIKLIRMG